MGRHREDDDGMGGMFSSEFMRSGEGEADTQENVPRSEEKSFSTEFLREGAVADTSSRIHARARGIMKRKRHS